MGGGQRRIHLAPTHSWRPASNPDHRPLPALQALGATAASGSEAETPPHPGCHGGGHPPTPSIPRGPGLSSQCLRDGCTKAPGQGWARTTLAMTPKEPVLCRSAQKPCFKGGRHETQGTRGGPLLGPPGAGAEGHCPRFLSFAPASVSSGKSGPDEKPGCSAPGALPRPGRGDDSQPGSRQRQGPQTQARQEGQEFTAPGGASGPGDLLQGIAHSSS